jgi:hypothetical protein
MSWSLDARIPVTVVADAAALHLALAAGPPAAVSAEPGALDTTKGPMAPDRAAAMAGVAPPGAVAMAAFRPAGAAPHAPACPCCAGRSPAAAALDLLFQARARGQVPWFERVLVLAPPGGAARAEILAALAGDRVTAARFRPG